jgi:hypothetical protein
MSANTQPSLHSDRTAARISDETPIQNDPPRASAHPRAVPTSRRMPPDQAIQTARCARQTLTRAGRTLYSPNKAEHDALYALARAPRDLSSLV